MQAAITEVCEFLTISINKRVSLVDRCQRLWACGFMTKLHCLNVESILNLPLVLVKVNEDLRGSSRRKTEKERRVKSSSASSLTSGLRACLIYVI